MKSTSVGPAKSKPTKDLKQQANKAEALGALASLAANRIAIEGVAPEIDGGRFAAKTIVGEEFIVEADVFSDGHDSIEAALLYRPHDEADWRETAMELLVNDRWRASFVPDRLGCHRFTIIAWRNLYATWHKEVGKKYAAGQQISLELEEGKRLLEAALDQTPAPAEDYGRALRRCLESFAGAQNDAERLEILTAPDVVMLMRLAGRRTNLSRYERELDVHVDRKAASFSAWYELFPRSQSGDPSRHGTFNDVVDRLPYVQELGFDVLYFPPIHPIGKTNRKGRNNSLTPGPEDPGSPYAIGSEEGGHDALHPELGSFEDFANLVDAARRHGLEVAIDFAIQCSPDHPWIKQHPEWFDWRPDGTIKFAENPPKKYEDIVNVHFYRDAIPGLWGALRDIVLFWIDKGVTIFRVDNPHTKPFPFWEWMIADVRSQHPEAIFLAEAFTRPKVMKRLAKVGFSQSYSYFTWRNQKWEIEEYLTELTTGDSRHYMSPNFFANTPDINPVYLQYGGRPAFQARLVLAATLGGNYGIYNGFEICQAAAVPGKEEYLNSEKYEISAWNFDHPDNISWDIKLMNRLRRNHKALQAFTNLTFYNAFEDSILYYGKRTPDNADFLLFHVCLDPHNPHEASYELPLWELGLPDDAAVEVEDLVTGHRATWHGKYQRIRLDPYYKPYAIWRLIAPGVTA